MPGIGHVEHDPGALARQGPFRRAGSARPRDGSRRALRSRRRGAVAAGRGRYGAFLSAGVLASTVTTFVSVPVRVQRFPLALGVVAARDLRAGWWIGADVGAVLALLRIRGEGLDTGGPALRFDPGAR